MNKKQFLKALNRRLRKLTNPERAGYIDFYSELIDDNIENGKSEEEAVAMLGNIDDIAVRILSETTSDAAKSSLSMGTKTAILIALFLGSPIWVSLLAALFAVVVSLLAATAAIIVSLFAASFALAIALIGGIVSFAFLVSSNMPAALFQLGAGILSLGLSVLLFFATLALSKLLIHLLKYIFIALRKRFFSKVKSPAKISHAPAAHSKTAKRATIIAAIVAAIGIIIVFTSLAAADFKIGSIMPAAKVITGEKIYNPAEIESISIESATCDINVVPCGDNQIHISYEYRSSKEPIFELSNKRLAFETDYLFADIIQRFKTGFFSWSSSDGFITIHLPETVYCDLELNTTNGNITLEGFASSNKNSIIECDTTNGDISLTNISAGSIEIDLTNGDITLLNVSAETLSADGVNTDILFDKLTVFDISFDSTNGDIKGSINGSINDYKISVDTTNGNTNIPGKKTGKYSVEADTTNGDIAISFTES